MWSPCSAEKIRENKRLGCLADRPHLLSQSQWDHSKTQQVLRYFYMFCIFAFAGAQLLHILHIYIFSIGNFFAFAGAGLLLHGAGAVQVLLPREGGR